MDDIGQFVQFASDKKWWALGALIIGTVVRLSKLDVRWFPNVDARWRPMLAAGLGVVLGGCDKMVAGDSWQDALSWGVSAAIAAMLGHTFVIETARGGKELPMPGSTPLPPAASALLIFLPALLAFGPSSCTKNGKTPITWPEVVQCGGDPLELVGKVSSILVEDQGGTAISEVGKQKLEALAAEKGAAAVLCIVDRLVREWIAPASSPEPHRIDAAKRGDSWLRFVGTHVQRMP